MKVTPKVAPKPPLETVTVVLSAKEATELYNDLYFFLSHSFSEHCLSWTSRDLVDQLLIAIEQGKSS